MNPQTPDELSNRVKYVQKRNIRSICKDWSDNKEELSILCNKCNQLLINPHKSVYSLRKAVYIIVLSNELSKGDDEVKGLVDNMVTMMNSDDLTYNKLAITIVESLRKERLKKIKYGNDI